MTPKTLFRAVDRDETIARVQRLRPKTWPQWGKMSVADHHLRQFGA